MSIGSGQWTKMNLLFFSLFLFFVFFKHRNYSPCALYLYGWESAGISCWRSQMWLYVFVCVKDNSNDPLKCIVKFQVLMRILAPLLKQPDHSISFVSFEFAVVFILFFSHLLHPTSFKKNGIMNIKKNSKNKEVAANLLNKRKTKCNKIKSTQHQPNMT